MSNGKQDLQESLQEWNGLFNSHGPKINLEKTEVLHIGHRREELDIELEGTKLTQWGSIVYLGGAVCGDGKTERERGTSKSTGWSERVESTRGGDGGPADLKKTKGQGHAHLCDTGMPVRNGNHDNDRTTTTKAASVRKQLGAKIARVTRADRRRMAELREETGAQMSLTERLVRSRLQWAGHVERMADDRLPKRAAELREQGMMTRGRPRLR